MTVFAQNEMARLGVTASDIDRAAVTWCGSKGRETFTEDIEYFRENWWALPGLRAYVENKVTCKER